MAGATNRAFKAAGIPKAAQKEIRVMGGRGLTLRSAISLAEKHGIAIGDKPKAFLAKRDERMAALKAAKRAPESPAMARMRDAKARVGELRAARNERRERMGRMRRRVDFARETTAMERTLNSPEMRAAVERAEGGYGPNAARREAKGLLRRAMAEVRDARKAKQFASNDVARLTKAHEDNLRMMKSAREAAKQGPKNLRRGFVKDRAAHRAILFRAARAAIEDTRKSKAALNAAKQRLAERVGEGVRMASAFRADAKNQRRHATLVERAHALRDMVDDGIPASRNRTKREAGFSPSWLK